MERGYGYRRGWKKRGIPLVEVEAVARPVIGGPRKNSKQLAQVESGKTGKTTTFVRMYSYMRNLFIGVEGCGKFSSMQSTA